MSDSQPRTQKITVEFELEIFESDGEHEVVRFVPVSIDSGEVSHQHMTYLLEYMREDDDASFDLGWDMTHALRDKLEG